MSDDTTTFVKETSKGFLYGLGFATGAMGVLAAGIYFIPSLNQLFFSIMNTCFG